MTWDLRSYGLKGRRRKSEKGETRRERERKIERKNFTRLCPCVGQEGDEWADSNEFSWVAGGALVGDIVLTRRIKGCVYD